MRSFLIACLILVTASLLPGRIVSQTILASESFDSISGSLPAGWSTVPYSPNTWTASSSLSSSGYPGASGGSNLLASNSGSGVNLSVIFRKNCSTINFSSISVSWGARKTASFTNQVIFEWSSDGVTWYSVPYTDISTPLSWAAINGGVPVTLPPAAQNVADLLLRWRYNQIGGGGSYRIDDVVVRGIPGPLRSGDGTASVLNTSPGQLSGGVIFPQSAPLQSCIVSVCGTASGLLDLVRITVPAGFSGLTGENISAGGAFEGKNISLEGNVISVTNAGLGAVPGTIAIAGLTSPDHSGPLDTGCDTFSVATAVSGGSPVRIVHPPVTWTIIPIRNIRTGGVDSYGNANLSHDSSAISGRAVAISGIVTLPNGVLSDTGGTSFILQDTSGYGIGILQPGTNTFRTVGQGDRIIVRGSIGSLFGSTILIPAAMTPPEFINEGTSGLPLPVPLTGAQDITEAYEGKLVTIPFVRWVSHGSMFDTVNAGKNRFTSGTDTGTAFVSMAGELYNTQIPAESGLTGVVCHRTDCMAGAPGLYTIVPRGRADLGGQPADGSGKATVDPAAGLQGSTGFSESVTVSTSGPDTIGGVAITLPVEWSWTGNPSHAVISGSGFASGSTSVSGDGSAGNPYVITISGARITPDDSGKCTIDHCTLPAQTGTMLFSVATRGAHGLFTGIAFIPSVNIVSNPFEPCRSGNWSDPATWAGGIVPSAADRVTMTTGFVSVRIDSSTAVCSDCTITGSGSVPGSGPVLRFAETGHPVLTVYGKFSIGGGTGGGGGDRGGRPWLTSAGNPSAKLVLYRSVAVTCSNTPANGNAGFNMNEGEVILAGSTKDTLSNSSGFRMANLEIGDGSGAKIVLWKPSANGTLLVRKLTLRQNASLLIGSASNSYANSIGNGNADTLPHLTGGITLESGAILRAQNYPGHKTTAAINCDSGGILNDGTIDLGDSCTYSLVLGIGGGAQPSRRVFAGSGTAHLAGCIVSAAETLAVRSRITIGLPYFCSLNGVLDEPDGWTIAGTVQAERIIASPSEENFGGIGLTIRSDSIPGNTSVTRITGEFARRQSGSASSILRTFRIRPSRNTGLHTTISFSYASDELDGQEESSLRLWKSDEGLYWREQPAVLDTVSNRLVAVNVNSLSELTAADTANVLSSAARRYAMKAGWNIASVPLTVSDLSFRNLFPTSVSKCFIYQTGYVPLDTLRNGIGFWLKFGERETVTITGTERLSDTIRLTGGWQMIGSVSPPVAWKDVVRVPSGIITSELFGYGSAYEICDTIEPGRGYWIRSSGEGRLIMNPGASSGIRLRKDSRDGLLRNVLTFIDVSGNRQVLRFGRRIDGTGGIMTEEFPPVPPDGGFDIRFRNTVHASGPDRSVVLPIEFRGVRFPCSLLWQITGDEDMECELVADTLQDIVIKMTGDGNAQLNSGGGTTLRIAQGRKAPGKFALKLSGPNPFNPVTTFLLNVPSRSHVGIGVYDYLGRLVRTLMSGEKDAGTYRVIWDGTNEHGNTVAGGIYFVRGISQRESSVVKVVLVR